MAEKLRALLQSRARLHARGWGATRVCRDYYDLWAVLKREVQSSSLCSPTPSGISPISRPMGNAYPTGLACSLCHTPSRGKSLRFLYAIPRYSEDLAFALERPGPAYDFRAYLRAIQRAFTAEGYAVTIKLNDQKIIQARLCASRVCCTNGGFRRMPTRR